MNSSLRSTICRRALLALGCAFGLALVLSPAAQAAEATTLQRLADKAPSLPVTTTVEKTKDGTVPPYVMHVKNTSNAPLKVSAKVLLAVVHHNADKARVVPAHVIEPGQSWTISELAALDRVLLTAEGFALLDVEVK